MDITDELLIAAQYEKHGGRAQLMKDASREICRIRRLARSVCDLDWSENDDDAVQRIDALRAGIVSPNA